MKQRLESEIRSELAKDLSRKQGGMDAKKAARIMRLPLFEVALEGRYGMYLAQRYLRKVA